MPKKKITLSIEEDVYNKYKNFCEENAILLSKRIELFMKGELERGKSKKK